MVTPAAKREAVVHLRSAFEVSERRACSVLEADGPRSAIVVRGQMMQPCEHDCVSWLRNGVGSATGACTSFSPARGWS